MEKSEISEHEIRVFKALNGAEWLTSAQVADVAKVAPRTARHHCKRLHDLGIVDTAEVFPGHRYRVSEHARKRNPSYMLRLDRAIEVVG